MNVLSLFDGISCGRVALERAGIPVANYFASEVDKYAIQTAKKNYSDTIHIGDVTKVFAKDLPKIDLLIGGSPCQGFSFAGKQLNFDDPRSKLFFEFVRLLKETNPKYFLLENVRMKKEFQDVISKELGVEPVEINSALVSAQNRRRLYWANFPITQPEDRGILLKDVIIEGYVDREKSLVVTSRVGGGFTPERYLEKSIHQGVFRDKSQAILATLYKENSKSMVKRGKQGLIVFESLEKYKVPMDQSFILLDKEVNKGKIGFFRIDSQANRVYSIHGKAVTLCGEAGGGAAKMGQYLFGVITPDRVNKRQNGQRFSEGNKFYTLTAQDRHGILTEGYIRKLTPIECERLQTLPDNYTEGVSDSQRYKMLGNGWTVDVISYIFKHMETTK